MTLGHFVVLHRCQCEHPFMLTICNTNTDASLNKQHGCLSNINPVLPCKHWILIKLKYSFK